MQTLNALHATYSVVDTFTSTKFAGNPAAVCFLNTRSPPSDALLQRIAQDIASVEVAFVMPSSSKADFSVRFFTKTGETPFCGHALIAAAHAIYEGFHIYANSKEIHFLCVKQDTTAVVRKLRGGLLLELSVKPTLPTEVLSGEQRSALAAAVSLPEDSIRSVFAHKSGRNLIVVLKNASCVVAAKTDRNKVLTVLGDAFSKLTLTAPVDASRPDSEESKRFPDQDFVSRLFAPKIGIDEDHCSGASHAMLALLYKAVLDPTRFGDRPFLRAYQASPRGGFMTLTFRGVRVGVAGGAVTSTRGKIALPAKL